MNKKKRPKGEQFNVRLTRTQLVELKAKAEFDDISVSTLVRRELLNLGIIPYDGKNNP